MRRRIGPQNLHGLPAKSTRTPCVLGGPDLHMAVGVADCAVQISKPTWLGKAFCLVDAQHTLCSRRHCASACADSYSVVVQAPV